MLADSSAQVVDCCCNFDALFEGRCCLKFVAANVDEPLVELMPLLGFCPFRIHDVLQELKLLCSLSSCHFQNVGKNEGPVRSTIILKFCPLCAASSFSLPRTVQAGHGVGILVCLQVSRL